MITDFLIASPVGSELANAEVLAVKMVKTVSKETRFLKTFMSCNFLFLIFDANLRASFKGCIPRTSRVNYSYLTCRLPNVPCVFSLLNVFL